jgi:Na+/melibiose symporter-like transporter
LVVIYALVPTVLKVGAIVLIWGHPLTERRQRIIRRRLASRNQLSERGMVQ